jgi:hypothetical protein
VQRLVGYTLTGLTSSTFCSLRMGWEQTERPSSLRPWVHSWASTR